MQAHSPKYNNKKKPNKTTSEWEIAWSAEELAVERARRKLDLKGESTNLSKNGPLNNKIKKKEYFEIKG